MQNYVLEKINLFVLGDIDIGVCVLFLTFQWGMYSQFLQATPTELGLVGRDVYYRRCCLRPWRDAWIAVSL